MKNVEPISASQEDYVEAIYLIAREKEEVYPRDVSARLEVTGPSVTEALRILDEKGLVSYVPYGPIVLTPLGEATARDVYHRHVILRRFFTEVLGVEEGLADEVACKLEHTVSTNIVNRLVAYARFAETNDRVIEGDIGHQFRLFLDQQAQETAGGERS
ncbi:MAG: metal-dependent transcriptional regulator [Desulfobulbus sp.]|jgi:DtxR family Mn-dependent transcriptional regulator